MKTHRRKIFLLAPEVLMGLLEPGEHHYRVVRDGIPADARIVGWSTHLYFDHDMIAVKVESESFDPVEEARIIPTANPILRSCPEGTVKASEA